MHSRHRIQKKQENFSGKHIPAQVKSDSFLQTKSFASEIKDDTPVSEVLGNLPSFDFANVSVQPKLTIGEPNDRYEQEADRVASDVVKQINSGGTVESKDVDQQGLISQVTSMPVQRDGGLDSGPVSSTFESQLNNSRGGGSSLNATLRDKLESAMGADFSQVKIHTDNQSDQLNRSIQAKAFTTGQDVFFKQGAYDPNSRSGQELIAHELTHVVQQSGGNTPIQRTMDDVVSQLPNGAKWSDFTSYALSEFNQEGPSFLQAASVYRKMGRGTTVAAAQKIYDKYCAVGSSKEINVSSRVRGNLTQAMTDSTTSGVPDVLMFDAAEREITSLCGDILIRFKTWWSQQQG